MDINFVFIKTYTYMHIYMKNIKWTNVYISFKLYKKNLKYSNEYMFICHLNDISIWIYIYSYMQIFTKYIHACIGLFVYHII